MGTFRMMGEYLFFWCLMLTTAWLTDAVLDLIPAPVPTPYNVSLRFLYYNLYLYIAIGGMVLFPFLRSEYLYGYIYLLLGSLMILCGFALGGAVLMPGWTALADMVAHTKQWHPSISMGDAWKGSSDALSLPLVQDIPLHIQIFVLLFGGTVAAVAGSRLLQRLRVPHPKSHGPGVPARTFTDLTARYPELAEFTAAYERDLAPWMAAQETRRRQALRIRHAAYVFGLPMAALFLLTGQIYTGLFMLAWVFAAAETNIYRLKKDIKQNLVGKLCEFLHLTYQSKYYDRNLSAFTDMDIVPRFQNTIVNDEFSGTYKGVRFGLYNVVLTNGNPGERQVEKFRGILLELNFPHDFPGVTKVLTDRGRLANNLIRHLAIREERVNLVYSGFENAFEVYASDQVTARMVLTPDVMENMVKLSRLLCGETAFQAAFRTDTALMTFRVNGGLFDISLKTPMTNPAPICRFIEQVMLVHAVIDTAGFSNHSE